MILEDKILGKFKPRKNKYFEKEIVFSNEQVMLSIDTYKYCDEKLRDKWIKEDLKTAHKLFADQNEWLEKIKNFVVQELLEFAKSEDLEWWIQLNKLSKNHFFNRIKMNNIIIEKDGIL